MDGENKMNVNNIFCPLTNTEIDDYQCYLYCEAVEGNIPENELPQNYDRDKDRKICTACQHHSID